MDASEVVNRNESSDGYSRVVAILNGKWRVIECRDRVQWILQSRDSPKPEAGLWRGRSYCRTKEALLRVCAAHAGKIAAAALAALPDWIEPSDLPATADKIREEAELSHESGERSTQQRLKIRRANTRRRGMAEAPASPDTS